MRTNDIEVFFEICEKAAKQNLHVELRADIIGDPQYLSVSDQAKRLYISTLQHKAEGIIDALKCTDFADYAIGMMTGTIEDITELKDELLDADLIDEDWEPLPMPWWRLSREEKEDSCEEV